MVARSPLERGRCAEPDMVPADPGGTLGAELWAVKEGPCHSTCLALCHTPNAAIGCHVPHRDAGSGTSNCFQKRTDSIGYRLYVLRITPKRPTPDPSPARFAYAHVPIVFAATRIKVVTDIPCRGLPVVVPCEGD